MVTTKRKQACFKHGPSNMQAQMSIGNHKTVATLHNPNATSCRQHDSCMMRAAESQIYTDAGTILAATRAHVAVPHRCNKMC